MDRAIAVTTDHRSSEPPRQRRRSERFSARCSTANAAGTACRDVSSRDLPGRHRLAIGILAVLEHNAPGHKFVTDAIALLEVLPRARCGAIGDQAQDQFRIDIARLPLSALPLR